MISSAATENSNAILAVCCAFQTMREVYCEAMSAKGLLGEVARRAGRGANVRDRVELQTAAPCPVEPGDLWGYRYGNGATQSRDRSPARVRRVRVRTIEFVHGGHHDIYDHLKFTG
jgi:hypothetical protein